MPGFLLPRYLPVILLAAALPAAPQTSLAFSAENNTSENTAATTDVPDVSFADQDGALQIQLTPEKLGDIYLVRQRYIAAIREYLKIDHPSASVWNKMGISYQQMFALKEAERCYKESFKLDSRNPKVLNNLATVQDGMKDYGTAERNYRKSLKLNPDSAVTLKNLGTNLLMQHKYDEGAKDYKQALALNPRIFDEHPGPVVNDPAPREEHGTAAYFKAKSCARAGLSNCAINYLIKAFNEGAATIKKVNEEEDFASLRGTAALTRLLSREQ